MSKITNTFEDFLANQAPQIDLGAFALNLGVATLLAAGMAAAYARWGRGQAYRSIFASNFFLITLITMLVISVVKSSLALSLGLVGALSVIRFRTAIKDPEELGFLFLSIATGLGLGADQRAVTVTGVLFVLLVFVVLKWRRRSEDLPGAVYLHVLGETNLGVQDMQALAAPQSKRVRLKRSSAGETIFLLEPTSVAAVDEIRRAFQQRDAKLQLIFTEYQDLT